jgi:hypothetical protein
LTQASGALTVIEINQAVAASTSLTNTADGGATEIAIANALGVITAAAAGRRALVIVYGTGADAGKAGLYHVVFGGAGSGAITSGTTDVAATDFSIELIGILNNVTADSITSNNFTGG